jgi:hypothetical protein
MNVVQVTAQLSYPMGPMQKYAVLAKCKITLGHRGVPLNSSIPSDPESPKSDPNAALEVLGLTQKGRELRSKPSPSMLIPYCHDCISLVRRHSIDLRLGQRQNRLNEFLLTRRH